MPRLRRDLEAFASTGCEAADFVKCWVTGITRTLQRDSRIALTRFEIELLLADDQALIEHQLFSLLVDRVHLDDIDDGAEPYADTRAEILALIDAANNIAQREKLGLPPFDDAIGDRPLNVFNDLVAAKQKLMAVFSRSDDGDTTARFNLHSVALVLHELYRLQQQLDSVRRALECEKK
jgi:hypothetical protein